MVILHEALRDGATVAESLVAVRRAAKSPVAKVTAYSLLCFGYGEATLTG